MGNFRKKSIILLLLAAGILFPCTIAVVSGSAAGYPILWKNRDVFNSDQEMRYFDTSPYRFVSNVYKGETHRAWAGLNDAGFGIVNTDTYNQGAWGTTGPDDGEVMYWALANCLTVEDFESYLDSTNSTGRKSTHCYGVIDAFGGASVFEAGRYSYSRFDADDSPDGILVRTNYADSGSDTLIGEERRARAEEILDITATIDPYLFLFILARDLVAYDFDPYPLPFTGTYGSLPAGVISTEHSINRYYTTSSTVIQGVGKTGAPGVVWEYLGQPIVAMPIPIWVQAGEVPDGLCSPSGSELCQLANEFKSLVYTTPTTVNTYPLADLLDFFYSYEEEIYSDVQDLYDSGPLTFEDTVALANFQQNIADEVLAAYYELREMFVREWRNSLPNGFDIEVHPNPFNSSTEMQIFMPSPTYAEVRLYDMTGRLTRTPLTRSVIPAGRTTVRISSNNLTSGVYLASLIIDGEMKASKRLIVVK